MQPIPLDLYALFARVAESGSLTKAARDLGLAKATVSKRLAELEQGLGVALIARTTRRMGLTEAGERVLRRAQRMLEEAEGAREDAGEARAAPRGRLKVSAPVSFALRYIAPVLPEFFAAYPEISLDLRLADRAVDLIGEGYDAAVRISALEDSSLTARKLAPVRLHVVGAPGYLAARGTPKRPEDLALHACFRYANQAEGSLWKFEGPGGAKAQTRVEGPLVFDNGDSIMPALCAGVGLALLPDFMVWEDIRAGRLVPVMSDWRAGDLTLHVLTAPGRNIPRKVRVFSDFLADRFGAGRAVWI